MWLIIQEIACEERKRRNSGQQSQQREFVFNR